MSPTLHNILDLQEIGVDKFSAPAVLGGDRIFGGYLLGQALVAACRTAAADRLPNSIQASFLRAGVGGTDLTLEVDRIRDGGSFSNRRVVIHQGGRELLAATVSMHTGEEGEDWQPDRSMEGLLNPSEAWELPIAKRFSVMDAFEVRTVNPSVPDGRRQLHPYWVRATEDLGDEAFMQYAAVLVISDLGIIGTARSPHTPIEQQYAAMSLDHTLWWHRTPRADQWMCIDVEATTNAQGRGMAHGRVLSEDGVLLATMNQEILLRMPVRKPR